MAQLRNIYNKEDALRRLKEENLPRRVFSFYRYVNIENPRERRDRLFAEWSALGCLGRIYLAEEGINAQMSVPEKNWDDFESALLAHSEFEGMMFKFAVEQNVDAFWKLAIKVRKQIVADGLSVNDYDVTNVGTHLSAKDFNALAQEPDTVVVDMRNNYESAIGRFENALCPDVYTFQEALPKVKEELRGQEEKKVLLYCTGGIRCEKASSYLKHHGFQNVYQLHGGIIDYRHQIERENLPSLFKGKNFVFDERLGERITEDILAQCFQCADACDDYANCQNETCNRLFIQCQKCRVKYADCCSVPCQEHASLPEAQRAQLRKGKTPVKTTETFRAHIAVPQN